MIKQMVKVTKVILVIGKSDSLLPHELARLKAKVLLDFYMDILLRLCERLWSKSGRLMSSFTQTKSSPLPPDQIMKPS